MNFSKANKNAFPDLKPSSLMKLRHLSIISLAGKCRTIPYQTLSEHLGVDNIRDLEDLIIEAFYADIIKGKLDQLNNQLEIEFAIGRDVTDEQVNEILDVLENWYLLNKTNMISMSSLIWIFHARCKNCGKALETIETQITVANVYKQKQIDLQTNIDAEVTNLKKSIKIQEAESMSSSSKDFVKKQSKTKGWVILNLYLINQFICFLILIIFSLKSSGSAGKSSSFK